MKNSISISLILLFLSLGIKTSLGQAKQENKDSLLVSNTSQNGLSLNFKEDSIYQQASRFSFNFLEIKNDNPEPKNVGLKLTIPEGFELLYKPKDNYLVPANSSTKIPLRISARNATNSAVRYLVGATIFDTSKTLIASNSYYLYMEVINTWKVSLLKNELFYPIGASSFSYGISVKNTGNIPKKFEITTSTKNDLEILVDTLNFTLSASKDSIIVIPLRLNNKKGVTQSYKVKNRISTPDKSFILYQEILPLGTTISQHKKPWFLSGTTIDLLWQNVGKQDSRVLINTQGNISLNNGKALFYSYRSNYLTAANGSLSGNIFNVNYYGNNFRWYLGDLSEIYNIVRSGKGVKSGFKLFGGSMELLALQNKDLGTSGIGAKYLKAFDNKSTIENYLDYESNQELGTEIFVASSVYETSIGIHQLESKLGVGNEWIAGDTNISHFGHSGKIRYSSDFEPFKVTAEILNNSPYYPGIGRGVRGMNSSFEYEYEKMTIGPKFRIVNNKSLLYRSGNYQKSSQFRSAVYELPFSFNFKEKKSRLRLAPGLVVEEQDSIPYQVHRFLIIYSKTLKPKSTITINTYYGRVFYEKYLLNRTNRWNFNITLRNENWGFSARYQHGPFSVSESQEFILNDLSALKYTLSPYYEKEWWDDKVKTNLQSEFSFNRIDDQLNYSLRNRNDINLNSGWKLSLYNVYRFSRDKHEFNVNVGVKKYLDIPIVGFRKYKNLKVVAFKDLNTNGVFDKGDKPIDNVTIKINDNYFSTNLEGELLYKNISPDSYDIDLTVMSELRGWLSNLPAHHTVIIGRESKTHYIPFRETKYVTGQIKMIQDRYSNFQYTLDRIRVTASDSTGNSFSTFTNNEGQYFLNLPAGIYTISFNQSIFEKQFNILKNNVSINLMEGESYEVNFVVKEKKRRINIQRGSNDAGGG